MQPRFFDWIEPLGRRVSTAIPSSCALCGMSGDSSLCDGCRTQFFSDRPYRCAQCGLRLAYATGSPLQRCGECVKAKRNFDATIVATDYVAPVDHMVLALKFGSRLALAPLFGHMLRDAILREPRFSLPTLLMAVPLSEKRLAERGFNQALEIAKPLARAIAVPLAPTLTERTRDTLMQAQLPTAERHKNICNAFVVSGENIEAVRGQHIGVIDDVMTTGETLNEIAATLKRNGAARVTNLVFARTPPK